MASVQDVCVPVKYNSGGAEKTKFVKIGVAFPGKSEGTIYVIKLEALPLGDGGQATLIIREHKEYKKSGGGSSSNEYDPGF